MITKKFFTDIFPFSRYHISLFLFLLILFCLKIWDYWYFFSYDLVKLDLAENGRYIDAVGGLDQIWLKSDSLSTIKKLLVFLPPSPINEKSFFSYTSLAIYKIGKIYINELDIIYSTTILNILSIFFLNYLIIRFNFFNTSVLPTIIFLIIFNYSFFVWNLTIYGYHTIYGMFLAFLFIFIFNKTNNKLIFFCLGVFIIFILLASDHSIFIILPFLLSFLILNIRKTNYGLITNFFCIFLGILFGTIYSEIVFIYQPDFIKWPPIEISPIKNFFLAGIGANSASSLLPYYIDFNYNYFANQIGNVNLIILIISYICSFFIPKKPLIVKIFALAFIIHIAMHALFDLPQIGRVAITSYVFFLVPSIFALHFLFKKYLSIYKLNFVATLIILFFIFLSYEKPYDFNKNNNFLTQNNEIKKFDKNILSNYDQNNFSEKNLINKIVKISLSHKFGYNSLHNIVLETRISKLYKNKKVVPLYITDEDTKLKWFGNEFQYAVFRKKNFSFLPNDNEDIFKIFKPNKTYYFDGSELTKKLKQNNF